MTFKERLSEKANFCRDSMSIQEALDMIKEQLENFVTKRFYTISLVEAKAPCYTCECFMQRQNHIDIFIPSSIKPEVYLQTFIDALKELGFDGNNLTTGTEDCGYHVNHNIVLTW